MPPHAEVADEMTSGEAADSRIQPNAIDHTSHAANVIDPITKSSTCMPTGAVNKVDENSKQPPNETQWTPQTILSTIPAASHVQIGSSSPLQFFHILSRLKSTKREGWRRFGISNGESIADHMYRMSIITMVAPPALRARLDIAKCTKMALVHDMAELLVGDITPVDGVSKAEKSRREAATMQYLCEELLGNVDAGVHAREIRALWDEYEDSKTAESVFVHDVDKMELMLQMLDYERQGKGALDLGEFAWVARRIVGKEVQEWSRELLKERNAFWSQSVGRAPSAADSLTGLQQEQRTQYYAGSGSGPGADSVSSATNTP